MSGRRRVIALALLLWGFVAIAIVGGAYGAWWFTLGAVFGVLAGMFFSVCLLYDAIKADVEEHAA